MNITTTITINKPVKEVWDFYDNPDNLKLWLTNFKSFELISGNPGEAGTKAKHIYEEKGRLITMYETITEKIPYHKLSGTLTMPKMMESNIQTVFKEIDPNKTELVCNTDSKFEMFSLKLFGFLLKNGFQKRQDDELNKLKMVIENI